MLTTAGHIFWAKLSGATDAMYSYTIDVPIDALGTYTFSGTYAFNSMTEKATILGNTTVTVGTECVKGELNGVPGLTANDALIALRMSIGLETPNLCAADVVAPFGTVDAADASDALHILRASVRLVTL